MPCITEDPTQAVFPSFEGTDWDILLQPMIDAHIGDVPLTVEEASQWLKEAWAHENNHRVGAWNTQLEQDCIEQEDRDRLVREEVEA